ncbi:hypothetical protein AAU61_03395 [Desulfocarbo indianensis]|nr:hypothetical protein AAU61_03395 [Desulfocarbo indianensis]
MCSAIHEVSVTWCPGCGQPLEVRVDRVLPLERPGRHEAYQECPQCGCQQCHPRQGARHSRPLSSGPSRKSLT